MGELQPKLSAVMAENFAIEDADRKAKLERDRIKLPTPRPATPELKISQADLMASTKADLRPTIDKMIEEEARKYQEKIRDAEIGLSGATKNRDASIGEYNEHNKWNSFISRGSGLTATLKKLADKETEYVVACEKKLAALRKEAAGEKDPNSRHPGLVIFEKAERLERAGKTDEAAEAYQQAASLIGGTLEAKAEAVATAGSNIRAMDQTAVKKIMADYRGVNEQLDAVVKTCEKWESRIKTAATILVIAPTMVLSIPAGLAVGLTLALAYGAAHLYGQHVGRGRDFKESLQEAWSETVDLGKMVVMNAAGGVLFKAAGSIFGVLGQGPLRLLANAGAGGYKTVRALFTPIKTISAGASGAWNLCKSGVGALRASPGAAWTATKNFCNPANSSLLKLFRVVPRNPSPLAGPGVYKAAEKVVSPTTWGQRVAHFVPDALHFTFVQQPKAIFKTAVEFFVKDSRISQGHIVKYFTGTLLPSAPRALSAGTSAFLTGGTVSAAQEVIRVRSNNETFEEHLKRKYGPEMTIEHFEAAAKKFPKEAYRERVEWENNNRINLRNILYTAGINGATTALATVIRIKKPPMSAKDQAAFKKVSDESYHLAMEMKAGAKVLAPGAVPPPGSAASFPTGTQTFKTYRQAAKAGETFGHAGVDHYVKPGITTGLGKYDTSPLMREVDAGRRMFTAGRKSVLDHVQVPYAPGKLPGRTPVDIKYPKGFDQGADKFLELSRDVASRIPSNAYRNVAAVVAPMVAHGYLTHVKNMSDPNLRPGESTYTMQDLANGMFYTMGGIKFGEGYTAGFNKALAWSPADKITFRQARVDKIPDPKDSTKMITKKVEEVSLKFRAKEQLPAANRVLRTGEGKAVFGKVGSELATDVAKVGIMYGGYRAVDYIEPRAIPWLIEKLTGLDPLKLTEWVGRTAREKGVYGGYETKDYSLSHLRTMSINEMFEHTASKNGFNLSANRLTDLEAPRMSSLFLPEADRAKAEKAAKDETKSRREYFL